MHNFSDIPRSSVEGVIWPALTKGVPAVQMAIQFQLERSQWWPGAVHVSNQFRQLRLLLRHAYKHVPYYREYLDKSGIDLTGELDMETWSQLPLLTRGELHRESARLNSDYIPRSHGKVHMQKSSGSTGIPVKIKQTEICTLFWRSFALREHLWHRRDLTAKSANIRHLADHEAALTPAGLRIKGWGAAVDGIFPAGNTIGMHSRLDLETQVQWLLREMPAYLLAYPSILETLARYFIAHKFELPGLVEARTFGEALGPETRRLCREAWNVPLTDVYSSQETGYLALQCPDHEHYHVQSEGVLIEILDEDNRPCAPGETGKVVVTVLHNFATPLIRYDIGDYAEPGEPCSCGRGLPVLKQIHGRTRNLAVLPDGRTYRPSVGFRNFEKIAPVIQAQLIQHTLQEVEARLVVDSPLNASQEQALKDEIQKQLDHPFEVSFTYLEEIPRSPTGKFEDFMSEVKPDPA